MQAKPKKKTALNLAFLGHVDAGKSNLAGILAIRGGGVDKRILEKLEKEANELGKTVFKYAWILDKLKAQRELNCFGFESAFQYFETLNHNFKIIDAPGYRDYINRLIAGAAIANAIVLVVSASLGEFEAGICRDGQTREHANLAFTLGVKQIIVCVNKMDDKTVDFSQSRFEEIQSEVQSILKKIGYNPNEIPFIPISSFDGSNVFEKSSSLSWFQGPTLIEALDALPEKYENKLRIPVSDIYKAGDVGTVVVGKIESGVLRPGMQLFFAPGNIKTECKEIEINGESVQEAVQGDIVGFSIKDVDVKDIKKGYVCGDAKSDFPRAAEYFEAQIIVADHQMIMPGYCPVIHCHNAQIACTFSQITARVDRITGAVLERNPASIQTGDSAIVTLIPTKPICVEPFQDYPSLGKITIKDLKKTVAMGVVKSVKKGKILLDYKGIRAYI